MISYFQRNYSNVPSQCPSTPYGQANPFGRSPSMTQDSGLLDTTHCKPPSPPPPSKLRSRVYDTISRYRMRSTLKEELRPLPPQIGGYYVAEPPDSMFSEISSFVKNAFRNITEKKRVIPPQPPQPLQPRADINPHSYCPPDYMRMPFIQITPASPTTVQLPIVPPQRIGLGSYITVPNMPIQTMTKPSLSSASSQFKRSCNTNLGCNTTQTPKKKESTKDTTTPGSDEPLNDFLKRIFATLDDDLKQIVQRSPVRPVNLNKCSIAATSPPRTSINKTRQRHQPARRDVSFASTQQENPFRRLPTDLPLLYPKHIYDQYGPISSAVVRTNVIGRQKEHPSSSRSQDCVTQLRIMEEQIQVLKDQLKNM